MSDPPILDKLKPYPGYKDSGLPWLGTVPSHWRDWPAARRQKADKAGR